MPVKLLERKAAADADVTNATLRRAYKRARVLKERIGFGPGATWVAVEAGLESYVLIELIDAQTLQDERLWNARD